MQDLCHDTYFKLCRHEMLYLMDILLVIIWEKVRLELVVVCWAVVVETGLCCIVTQVQTSVGIEPWIVSWMSLTGFICSINSKNERESVLFLM